MQKLSEHFNLDEFVRSEKEDQGVPDGVLHHLMELCVNVLEPLRAKLGKPIQITSGYRSPAHNAAIGGAKNSLHTTGMAADLSVGDIPDQIKVAAILSKIPAVGGIGLYEVKGIVHVDIRPHVGRPTTWLEKANGQYVPLPLTLKARINLAGGKV